MLFSLLLHAFGYVMLHPIFLPGVITATVGATSGQSGVLAGIVVGYLSLTLLFAAASVIITFLCTRKCYNRKRSTAPPGVSNVHYETDQSDSVQMQPSPAYQSVDDFK